MGLERYRQKRNFDRTSEPRGGKSAPRTGPLRFIVQKHEATRLHYDFRLELNGVLKSWAVPKGPSLDPSTKRLAMHVEDHPIEYGSFEGVIPEGEYGGGTVMLWDRGHWFPERDPERDYARGRLKFKLEGEKLRGHWNLVRTGGREGRDENSWLLIKERDEDARPGDGDSITEERAESIATGRSMKAIARQRDRVWSSREGEITPERTDPAGLTRAKRATLPKTLEPELATLGDSAPEGDDWLHEMKLDGYRILVRIDGKNIRLLSRNGKDWTDRFREIASAAEQLPCRKAMIDGEVVVLDGRGVSDFQSLQNALSTRPENRRLFYFAFDIVHVDGFDVRSSPVGERKALLETILGRLDPEGAIRYSDHVRGRGRDFFDQACNLGLEGIISKRADSPYRSGRGTDWRKTKCTHRQEFVIVGYTEPKGSRTGFGSLLLAVHDADGRLVSAGRVGTGFTSRTIRDLYSKLERLERTTAPVVEPPKGAAVRDVHWVKPQLVAEVAFSEWTADGAVRHPSFQGLRDDKSPEQIVREMPENDGATTKRVRRAAGDETVEVAGVRLTNPDRVLWPEQGTTKRQLAEYYAAVADAMLPHLRDRPLTLVRCPTGHGNDCFFQKHANEGVPDLVPRVEVPEERRTGTYMRIAGLPSVIALVQLGVLEFHVWGALADRLDRPDRLIFDLDPDPDLKWTEVVAAAMLLRIRLTELGLQSFVKTTGGKGLHVVFPIDRRTTWDDAKAFTNAVATEFARRWPHRFTDVMSKKRRRNRIYMDFLRNAYNSTSIAAYSTRARPRAPVSVPLEWDELENMTARPVYDITNVLDRLRAMDNEPWSDLIHVRQSITKSMMRDVGLR